MSVIPYKIEIELAEQIITIKPNDVDVIVLSATELDGSVSPSIYLDLNEMKLLIQKMMEMMEYINPKPTPASVSPVIFGTNFTGDVGTNFTGKP